MLNLSKRTVPGFAVFEGLLCLELEGHLCELLLMTAYPELLREAPVLEAVGLVVGAPLGVLHGLLQQHPLLDKLCVLLAVPVALLVDVLEVVLHIDVCVLPEPGPVDHFPRALLGLLVVNGRQVLHLLKVLAQHLPLEWGHSSQESGGVTCPNFPLLHLLAVSHHCPRCHDPSRVDCGVPDRCAHGDEGVALQVGALESHIGAHKDVVPDLRPSRYVHSVLEN